VIEELARGDADVVVGSRFVGDVTGFASTPMRRVGIRLLSWALRVLGGPAVTDVTSGLRAFNRRALELLARQYPPDYPEPEALLILETGRCRIKEVPVAMSVRAHGTSSISRLDSAFYMARVLLGMVLLRASRQPVISP
jgi:hypothetical protein